MKDSDIGHPGLGPGIVQMSELNFKQDLDMSFLFVVQFIRIQNDPNSNFYQP